MGDTSNMSNFYLPEGSLLTTHENREYIYSLQGLEKAMNCGKILEATVLRCDSELTLYLDLYGIRGIIRKTEAVYMPCGEQIKDISVITRVGKPVCFKVLSIEKDSYGVYAVLSRREAQLECYMNYFNDLICGDIIPAKVTHLESFGAFVDIGCGVSSLLSVDCISVSRISHPQDRLRIGMNIYVTLKIIDEDNKRFFVSMKELLGTWEQVAEEFEAGHTVSGIIRSIESYGVFIELAPNLAGLAELREDDSRVKNIAVGMKAAVYIKSISPEKMKIKLVLVDTYTDENPTVDMPRYYINTNAIKHINYWKYSPDCSNKIVETIF